MNAHNFFEKQIQLSDAERYYSGSVSLNTQGSLVLEVLSPRPVRIWFGGQLVLAESVNWMRYERQIRAHVVIPVMESELTYRVEIGEKPLWPAFVDEHSPSRVREQIRKALEIARPDVIIFKGIVHSGIEAFATSLRYGPTHCIMDGVTFQRTVLRPIPGFFTSAPSNDTNDQSLLVRPTVNIVSSLGSDNSIKSIEVTSDSERVAGLIAFLVPVANELHLIPPVRTGPRETHRVEPEIEIATSITVRIETTIPPQPMLNFLMKQPFIAPVVRDLDLDMPVYEARGRLAPLREFTPQPFPKSVDELLSLVPKPILPASLRHLQNLYAYSWDVLFRLYHEPRHDTGMVSGYFRTATNGFFDSFFVWDSSFATLALAYGFRAFNPLCNFDNLYARQFDGGYIHREQNISEGTPSAFEPDFSPNPPLMTLAEWSVFCLTGNAQRIAQVYPLLAAHHRWIETNRKLPDGTYWTTGLANGLDNSPSLGEGYPDLSAQMAHEAELLGAMARVLGKKSEAEAFEAERTKTAAAIDAQLWSEALQFYSTSLVAGGHNPNKVVTGFWPLWTGLVPPERVEALARQLCDPAVFDRLHPVPSLAADAPDFDPDGNYWRGSVWAPTNCAVILGFERSERHDLALRTTLKHLDAMHRVFLETGCIWENYSSDFFRKGNIGGPDYSWTSVGPIALLLEIVIGLKPDAATRTLYWQIPTESGYGVRNYALGSTIINLEEDWLGDGETADFHGNASGARPRCRIFVENDSEFSLKVRHGTSIYEAVLSAGTHRIWLDEMPFISAQTKGK